MERIGPTGFWSYTSQDDTASRGRLSQLRRVLADEIQQMVGRAPPVHLFQDVASIPPGENWEAKIRDALGNSSFLIPIITPGFLQSEWCCKEVRYFLDRERSLGRADLIFPIYYNDIEDFKTFRGAEVFDPDVLRLLRERQWLDFRDLRHRDPNTEEVALRLERLATGIRQALFRGVPEPTAADAGGTRVEGSATPPTASASTARSPAETPIPTGHGDGANTTRPPRPPPPAPAVGAAVRETRSPIWAKLLAVLGSVVIVGAIAILAMPSNQHAPPPPAPPPVAARSFLVFFDWNQTSLTNRAQDILREVAGYCASSSCQQIVVDGHADTSEGASSQHGAQGLSEQRALVAATELMRDGAPGGAITTHGYGATRLLVPTGPNVREPQNRRVEMTVR
jgi:outer membrane protein OmpA-like peptidoglycan-associated protein